MNPSPARGRRGRRVVRVGRSRQCEERGLQGLGKRQETIESPSALTTTLFYLQAMDEPGMSLLDQSVIKKGKNGVHLPGQNWAR